MDVLSPLILLHRNGYKALAVTKGDEDLRLVVAELRDKIVRLGEGHLDVTVGFAHRDDEIGDLGRTFNHMVQQLRENREEVERPHRARMSRAQCLATLGELATGLTHEIRNPLLSVMRNGSNGLLWKMGNHLGLSRE